MSIAGMRRFLVSCATRPAVDSRGASDKWGAVWEYNDNNNLSAPLVVVVRSLYSMGSPNHDGGSGWGDEQSLEPEKVAVPE